MIVGFLGRSAKIGGCDAVGEPVFSSAPVDVKKVEFMPIGVSDEAPTASLTDQELGASRS